MNYIYWFLELNQSYITRIKPNGHDVLILDVPSFDLGLVDVRSSLILASNEQSVLWSFYSAFSVLTWTYCLASLSYNFRGVCLHQMPDWLRTVFISPKRVKALRALFVPYDPGYSWLDHLMWAPDLSWDSHFLFPRNLDWDSKIPVGLCWLLEVRTCCQEYYLWYSCSANARITEEIHWVLDRDSRLLVLVNFFLWFNGSFLFFLPRIFPFFLKILLNQVFSLESKLPWPRYA